MSAGSVLQPGLAVTVTWSSYTFVVWGPTVGGTLALVAGFAVFDPLPKVVAALPLRTEARRGLHPEG